jgi:hypothetical protein
LVHQIRGRSLFAALDPRQWTNLSIEFDQWMGHGAPLGELQELLAVHGGDKNGPTLARAFAAYTANGDNPDCYPMQADKLLEADGEEWDKAIEPRLRRWIKEGRTPLLGATTWDLVQWLRHATAREHDMIVPPEPDGNNLAAILRYMHVVGLGHTKDTIENLVHACGANGSNFKQRLLDAAYKAPGLREGMIGMFRAYQADMKAAKAPKASRAARAAVEAS